MFEPWIFARLEAGADEVGVHEGHAARLQAVEPGVGEMASMKTPPIIVAPRRSALVMSAPEKFRRRRSAAQVGADREALLKAGAHEPRTGQLAPGQVAVGAHAAKETMRGTSRSSVAATARPTAVVVSSAVRQSASATRGRISDAERDVGLRDGSGDRHPKCGLIASAPLKSL